MKLRNMSATVERYSAISIELASCEIIDLKDAYVLKSYNSRVAVYGYNKYSGWRVYLLPRYDYSVTTWKHVHAFIQDCCDYVPDKPAREMREWAKRGVTNDGFEYAFANGIAIFDKADNHIGIEIY